MPTQRSREQGPRARPDFLRFLTSIQKRCRRVCELQADCDEEQNKSMLLVSLFAREGFHCSFVCVLQVLAALAAYRFLTPPVHREKFKFPNVASKHAGRPQAHKNTLHRVNPLTPFHVHCEGEITGENDATNTQFSATSAASEKRENGDNNSKTWPNARG